MNFQSLSVRTKLLGLVAFVVLGLWVYWDARKETVA